MCMHARVMHACIGCGKGCERSLACSSADKDPIRTSWPVRVHHYYPSTKFSGPHQTLGSIAIRERAVVSMQ